MDSVSSVDRAGFYLFTLCVVLAPIPFGSGDAIAAALIGLALSVCLLGSILVAMPNERAAQLYRSAALLTGVVILVCFAHSIPWHLMPLVDPASSNATGLVGNASGSAPHYQALYSAGYVLIPLVGFMCALVYIRDDWRYMRFVHIVIAVNLVVTAFCVAQYVVSPGSLLWADKRYYRDSFTGTFINPNTAATHFGVLLILALSLSLRQLERTNVYRLLFIQHNPNERDRTHLRMLIGYAAVAFVFLLALLLTKSRAGILSALAGVAVFIAAFAFFALRRRFSTPGALAMSFLSLLAPVALFTVFGERFLLRLRDQGLIEEGRICTYVSTWNAIKDGPWWGTGLGTFQDVFPAYRSSACGLYGYWEMAHSVFLEAWLGMGVLFLPCAALVYYHLIKTYGRGVIARRRYRFVPLACLGLLLLLTLHSLVDFSLQVPGFSLLAAGVLGAGAAVAVGRVARERSPPT